MDTKRICGQVIQKGWCAFDTSDDINTHEIAMQFGEIVPSRKGGMKIDRLIPKTRENANSRSLSAVYGRGMFPFHTDGSSFKVPPSRILLRFLGERPSDRPTLIVNFVPSEFDEYDLLVLQREIWLINGGKGRFYTSIYTPEYDSRRFLLRYDPVCMRPVENDNLRSVKLLDRILADTKIHKIHWRKGRCVLIDNWRSLHARDVDASDLDSGRILERAYII